jgi:hypothetical protein
MASSTRIHSLKNAVADGLALRAGLAGVQIGTAWYGDDRAQGEAIWLDGPDVLDGDWAALGRLSRDERITLQGVVYVRQPGAGETTIRAVRARCVALFAEIEAFIVGDPSVGGVVLRSLIRPRGLAESMDPEGRIGILTFELEAHARLTST